MNVLDQLETVKGVDRFDMLGKLREIPRYIPETLTRLSKLKLKAYGLKYSAVVIGGLGGSAIGGDVLRDWLSGDIDVPIVVNRGYGLPAFVNERTLFLAVSYSGNTFETLTQFDEALKRRCALYAITSGGQLEKRCLSFHVPLLKVPAGLPPRIALPYLFASLGYVMLLEGFLKGLADLEKASQAMMKLEEKIGIHVPSESNPCKKLALSLDGKLPVILGLDRFSSVARRFKTQLNENCKVQARYELIPELCHNEVESFRPTTGKLASDSPFAYFLMRSEAESGVESAVFEVIKEKLNRMGVKDVHEIWGVGGLLESLLTSIYTVDYLTCYLAILRGVDPTPVESIEEFKVSFKERLRRSHQPP
ncbi:MAG: bifunctional phosphoglucose/phosphomannose isomerase [Candidatus Bathyarchaeia archaeon]